MKRNRCRAEEGKYYEGELLENDTRGSCNYEKVIEVDMKSLRKIEPNFILCFEGHSQMVEWRGRRTQTYEHILYDLTWKMKIKKNYTKLDSQC